MVARCVEHVVHTPDRLASPLASHRHELLLRRRHRTHSLSQPDARLVRNFFSPLASAARAATAAPPRPPWQSRRPPRTPAAPPKGRPPSRPPPGRARRASSAAQSRRAPPKRAHHVPASTGELLRKARRAAPSCARSSPRQLGWSSIKAAYVGERERDLGATWPGSRRDSARTPRSFSSAVRQLTHRIAASRRRIHDELIAHSSLSGRMPASAERRE